MGKGVDARRGPRNKYPVFKNNNVGGKRYNLTNIRFGCLLVIKLFGRIKRDFVWLCQCDCGAKCKVTTGNLINGSIRSCGHLKIKNLVGRKFGRLSVISFDQVIGGASLWVCICDCNKNKKLSISGNSLTTKNTKSCGCLNKGVTATNKWKGGKGIDNHGYVKIYNATGHPNADRKGGLLEHVLVMSRKLGRPLREKETVHHLNGIRNDNREENLELWASRHPSGQRVSDMIKFCTEYLQDYKPENLIRRLR